jgi:dipeptidyl aminopeptidase/acylaminoacyl peptidase
MILLFVSMISVGFQLFPAESNRQGIDHWLILGPAAIPALESDLLKNSDDILKFNHIPMQQLLPIKGEKVTWNDGNVFNWQTTGKLDFDSGAEVKVVYLAAYLEPARWLKTDLIMVPNNEELKASVFLDGESINSSAAKDDIRASLELTHEKHLLIVKLLLPKTKTDGEKITVETCLENKEPFIKETVKLSLEPLHNINMGNILNVINVDEIHISPDSKLVEVSLKRFDKETGKSISWGEILNIANGETIFSSEHFGKLSNFAWLNTSQGFTYSVTADEKTSIIQYDLNSHTQQCILKGIKNLSSYWWAKDNSFLIYSVSHAREDKDGYRYIKEIPDRTRFPEDRSSMFLYFPEGSVTHPITTETQNFDDVVISPDSKKVLLIQKEEPEYKIRPYVKNVVYLFDMKNYSLKKILESTVLTAFIWAPDSNRLLALGGPTAFNNLGNTLPKEIIPNDYETEAYIFDLNTNKAEVISKKFNPNLQAASWTTPGQIYFTAEDTTFVPIFKYSLEKKTFTRMKTIFDVIHRVDFANHADIAVTWSSGLNNPQRLYKHDLANDQVSLLKDYNQEDFRYVTFGKWEDWNYKIRKDKSIEGRLYFPPDFDSAKKYPCITYYYGGTSPVERNFGGRYPMEWYAANGYVVYVLEPTGTTGYGQAASAVHVNDWGKVTSAEVISAVKELVRTHPYIDPARVGAMGASYGGFLTQYIATQTNVFAAFISHAGITSISSYWGEGDWGYNYSGSATADSFPWNRKDIYVDRSPLFLANKIQKPLLLLHGEEDNNVPPGESYQMFAALKLLGKDVSLITYAGQQHFILDYKKRQHWMRAIIAWWDKYLKNQPEHWDNVYKK